MLRSLFFIVLLVAAIAGLFLVMKPAQIQNASSAPAALPSVATPSGVSTPSGISSSNVLPPPSGSPSAPRTLGAGSRVLVVHDAQMIVEYGTWKVRSGTEVTILSISGNEAKVRANGQEGTMTLSALQP